LKYDSENYVIMIYYMCLKENVLRKETSFKGKWSNALSTSHLNNSNPTIKWAYTLNKLRWLNESVHLTYAICDMCYEYVNTCIMWSKHVI